MDRLRVVPARLPDVKILEPVRHRDARGFFSETYNLSALRSQSLDLPFVQDNHTLSRDRGTVRGLHLQVAPFAQAKLIRVVRGALFDVAVDLRADSKSFGQHVAVELSAENWHQLFIPRGFAHGFCTLEPNTEVIYKVSADYSPEHERGLMWNDPEMGIDWPVGTGEATLSDRDLTHPRLRDLPRFEFEDTHAD